MSRDWPGWFPPSCFEAFSVRSGLDSCSSSLCCVRVRSGQRPCLGMLISRPLPGVILQFGLESNVHRHQWNMYNAPGFDDSLPSSRAG